MPYAFPSTTPVAVTVATEVFDDVKFTVVPEVVLYTIASDLPLSKTMLVVYNLLIPSSYVTNSLGLFVFLSYEANTTEILLLPFSIAAVVFSIMPAF